MLLIFIVFCMQPTCPLRRKMVHQSTGTRDWDVVCKKLNAGKNRRTLLSPLFVSTQWILFHFSSLWWFKSHRGERRHECHHHLYGICSVRVGERDSGRFHLFPRSQQNILNNKRFKLQQPPNPHIACRNQKCSLRERLGIIRVLKWRRYQRGRPTNS